jgi:hypothetical protein
MSNLKLLMASGQKGSGNSAPTDANFNYVSALIHGNGSNTAANNTSVATSVSVLSRNGTTEGTFTPYGSNWSNQFDGSTGYLTAPTGSSLAFGTNDFTVECWVFLLTAQTTPMFIIDSRTSAQTTSWYFGTALNSATGLSWGNNAGNITSDPSSTDIPVGTWTHVAYSRHGTTGKLFVNGSVVSTVTDSTNYVAGITTTIGARYSVANFWNGFISNLRVVNGTALYTAAFTPSTSPLTAVTNTVLLTCQSNAILDKSSNSYSVTANGTVKAQRFNPFGDNGTSYGISTYGGSAWFDGSSGYLTAPSSTNYQFTGDFTIEAWIYPTSSSSVSFVSYWDFGVASSCAFLFGNSGNFLSLSYGIGSSNSGVTGTTAKMSFNAWNHIAVTRQGSTIRLFVNGIQDATTATASGSFNNSPQPLFIGADNNNSSFTAQKYFSGYMSDVRIVNGTALYTGNFTVNTAPLSSVTNTTLLYNAQSGGSIGIYDNAMQQDIQTIGTAQISNAQAKFSSSSMYFNGTLTNSVYPSLRTPGSALQLNSSNFTVEAWIYPTASSQSGQILGIQKNGVNTDWLFYLNAGKLGFHWNNSSDFTSSTSPTVNAWSHVAATRSGSTLYLFVNGTLAGSTTLTGSIGVGTGDNFTIGADSLSTGLPFTGYITEARITIGVARYTATFTAPTSAFPNSISSDPYFNYVALLIHGTGQNAYNNSVAVATMPQSSLSLTRAGTLTEGSFTPYGSNWSDFLSSTSTSSYLTYGASTSAGPANQTFTMEAWVMFDSLPTTTGSNGEFVIWQKGRTGTSNFELAWGVQNTGSGYQILCQVSGNGTTVASANSSNISLTAGTWNHFAITQVGGSGTTNFWFNGQSASSMSHGIANMFVGTGLAAIGNNSTGTNPTWQGYISNIRVVFGSQVYTSTFTPSSAPLTAITGTNVLTCQSSTYIDNSPNAWAITANGPMIKTRFNPFGDNATPYSTTTYGGSCWFAGSGSNLSYASSAQFGFGTGAFTIEAWVYVNAFCPNNGAIVDLRASVSSTALSVSIDSTGHLYYYDGPNNTTYSDTTALSLNTWYHVALTRDAFGIWRLFKNGSQVQTSTAADNVGSSQPLLIGQSINGTSTYFNGYISDLRITNGRALYTATFTPPTTPLTANIGTNFLYKAQNAGIYDNAMQQLVETLGAQISTSKYKFGGSSIQFATSTGTHTGMVALKGTENMPLGSRNFTIEGWFYVNGVSSTNPNHDGFFAYRSAVAQYSPIYLGTNQGQFEMAGSTTGSSWDLDVVSTASIPLSSWFHVAVVRNGSTITLYLNGTSIATLTTSAALMNPVAPLVVGASSTTFTTGTDYVLNGFGQDFRITYGLARYTANFTPPTTAFPNQ